MPVVFTLTSDIFATLPGQNAFAFAGDDAIIQNLATLSTSGTMASGIRVEGNNARVTNIGSVLTSAPFNTGITLLGNDYAIVNHGIVDSLGQPSRGIVATGNGGLVQNHGLVRAQSDGSRAMIVIGNENRVDNHGTIATAGVGAVTFQAIGNDNLTINHGTASAFSLTSAWALQGANNQLINYGLIENLGGRGVGLSGGANLVVNKGTIEAVIAIGALGVLPQQETVMNHGAIVGDVNLGSGNDLYAACQGGTLDGVLILGAGDDCVAVRQNSGTIVIADFAAGSGSDDVIDVTAFSAKDLDDVLAVSTQEGSDVVIRLDANATVVLQGVLLANLSADDFDFGPAAAAAATAAIPFA